MTALGPLNEVERRVLGVLIEKALAQPQYYPMTLNAIVVACNQKNNRDPVMELDEEAVWNTLEVLRAGGLVSRLLPGGASRVERYKHEVKEALGWEKPQRAILAELLLRGPQTVGELRGRCMRMYPFETTEAVVAVLDGLGTADPPLVATLPRQPGQSAVRHAHRLYTEKEWAVLASASPAGEPPLPTGAASAGSGAHDAPAAVEGLRNEVVELRARLDDLAARMDHLERRASAVTRSESE